MKLLAASSEAFPRLGWLRAVALLALQRQWCEREFHRYAALFCWR